MIETLIFFKISFLAFNMCIPARFPLIEILLKYDMV